MKVGIHRVRRATEARPRSGEHRGLAPPSCCSLFCAVRWISLPTQPLWKTVMGTTRVSRGMQVQRLNGRREESPGGITVHRLLVTIMAIVVAILAAPSSALYAQASDPASVMEDFNEAATDPEAAMQYLADDVTIRIIPPPPGQSGVWTGKEEARGFLEFTKSQDVRRELVGTWSVDGNTVSGTVMVTNKDFTALGVAPVEHTLDAIVEDGQITSWTSTMSPAERERVGAAVAARQPGTMPSTGAGGSAGSSGANPMFVIGGLVLALGLTLRLARARIR